MNHDILILIIGMTLVTYIPRAIPSVFIHKIHFSPKMEKFLRLIPYTAMAALIFPAIFTIDKTNPFIGIAGAFVAGVLAWKKVPLILVVILSILANWILLVI